MKLTKNSVRAILFESKTINGKTKCNWYSYPGYIPTDLFSFSDVRGKYYERKVIECNLVPVKSKWLFK